MRRILYFFGGPAFHETKWAGQQLTGLLSRNGSYQVEATSDLDALARLSNDAYAAGFKDDLTAAREKGAKRTARDIRKRGRKSWIVQADVGDSRKVRAMFEWSDREAGRIGLLVNNAGVQTWAPLLTLREEDWDHTIRTNLKGCFLCMQQAALRMRKQGGGCIINMGSGSNKAPFPNLVDYCASKGGLFSQVPWSYQTED